MFFNPFSLNWVASDPVGGGSEIDTNIYGVMTLKHQVCLWKISLNLLVQFLLDFEIYCEKKTLN